MVLDFSYMNNYTKQQTKPIICLGDPPEIGHPTITIPTDHACSTA